MIEYWVIPPEANAEFVANMEEVLEVYERPYDPAHPVLCMDEQPVQLLKETRVPIEATQHHAQRVDYEYGCGSNLGNRFGELAKTDGRNGGKIGKRGLLGSTRNIEPFPA